MSSFLTGEPWQLGNKAKVGSGCRKGKDSLELLQGQYHPLEVCENQKHALHLRAHCYLARFLAPWGEERLQPTMHELLHLGIFPLGAFFESFMNKGRENSEIVSPPTSYSTCQIYL